MNELFTARNQGVLDFLRELHTQHGYAAASTEIQRSEGSSPLFGDDVAKVDIDRQARKARPRSTGAFQINEKGLVGRKDAFGFGL